MFKLRQSEEEEGQEHSESAEVSAPRLLQLCQRLSAVVPLSRLRVFPDT